MDTDTTTSHLHTIQPSTSLYNPPSDQSSATSYDTYIPLIAADDKIQLASSNSQSPSQIVPTPMPVSTEDSQGAQKLVCLFLDLFASHSAPLSFAARQAQLDHFIPFDIEYNRELDILDDDIFEQLLQMVHAGIIGAIWSASPCRLYSRLRKNDGGPPPLRSIDHMEGLPNITPHQLKKFKTPKKSTEDPQL